uniref:CCHC-type domain-containing protein n=1 Tax=Vitis vinifera TaxID=29760 RepID=A5BNR8_VITVI|nr:hypothetical protein VITISV_005823 [Vitis vinifera]
MVDEVGIMLLYEEKWVQDGNAFYFERSKGKDIEVSKTISYKELLGVVYHILKLDPTNCFLSMNYVFNANISTSPIQLTDDGDVKFFIGLNCTNGELHVPLCIIVEKRIDNHNQKSICNSYSEYHMSSEIDKELNKDSMLMHKSTHVHCESVETLTVDSENGLRFQNESLEGYKVHDWNMNETSIDGDDHLEEHQIYSSKKELQRKLYMMALKRKFEFKTTKSTTKLLLVECFDKECKWRVRATKLGISNMFQIMKYYSTHTCRLDMMSRDNQHASSWLIGESIREIYQGVGCEFRPKDIIIDIRKQYGVQISYDKAQRVRELALSSIRGSPEKSYNTLSSYCYVLEQKNLGTITDIVTDCDNQFKYFFMLIGTSLVGFHTSIRLVVAIDGTFLKAKDLSILQLVEELRNLLQKWFVTRQQQEMSMSTELTMWADGELRSRFYNISCYTLCSQYFTTKALLSSYSKCIYPTGNEIDWVILDHIRNKIMLPPKTRRPTGRPRKVRIPSGEESNRISHCSRCGQYGHNRKTCKRPIP